MNGFKAISTVSAQTYKLGLYVSRQETANGHAYMVQLHSAQDGVTVPERDLLERKYLASSQGAHFYFEDTLANLRRNKAA